MAKSIYTTLNEINNFEITHGANTANFTLPSYLEGVRDILEDEEALIKWAMDHEIMHGLLHYGLQELLIKLRAVARPAAKYEKNSNVNIGLTINADKEAAQERINNFVIKPLKRPGTGGTQTTKLKAEKEKLVKVLKSMGKTDEEINNILNS